MTLLVVVAVLLIAGSLASLLGGLTGGDSTLIWASILATAGAAVLVVVVYLRARSDLSTRKPESSTDSGIGPAKPIGTEDAD